MPEKPTYEELEQRVLELEKADSKRKHTEEVMQENRERANLVLDTVPQSVFWKDLEGCYLGCNRVFATAVGLDDPAHIVGKTDFDLPWPREEAEAYRADDREVIENNHSKLHIIEQLQQADGTRLWIDTSKVPMCDTNGRPFAVLGVYEDITSRKQAEEALRLRESYLRAIIENQPGLVWLKDEQNQFLIVNEAFAISCGKQNPDMILGKTDFDIWPSELAQKYRNDDIDVMKSAESRTVEEQIFDRGVTKWFETFKNPIFDEQGTIIGTTGYARDITERKLAEELLKDEISRWRFLFEKSSDGIVILDQNGKVYEANKRYADMLGYSMEEITQLHVWDWDTQFSKEQIKEMIRLIDDTGAHFETRQRRKDGKIIDVELSNNGSVYKGHKLIFCICRDISGRKQIEAEKAKYETQYRQLQKAESLNLMAAAIAHNFNNQLQVVMGNLEMAIDDQPHGSKILLTLTEALKASRKAADVSGLMLAYQGQASGKQKPLDLSVTCRQNLPIFQAMVPKGMVLNVDFPASGPIILGNSGHIQQILTNLLTNAWESICDNQGVIGLTIKTVSDEDISPANRFPFDWQPRKTLHACMEIKDTGCGIADKEIEKIFDPFFTTKFTGRGMGLSVVLGIVGAHGGGVTVESEPGRGSVFRVFLPISTDEPLLKQGNMTSTQKFAGSGTVLLIEDEAQVRNMARIMLTRLGFTVIEANDGVEALEIFKQHEDEIRWVLSDLTMPRMNGWETLAALRKISPNIPVILSSGYDQAQVMAGEYPERPNAFLGKPYRLTDLAETISSVL
jgi:two-component system, cell cycle sensor histidine kinase and response regulator CckA